MPSDRFERIETLYHAARERPPEARSAFLSGACAGDEDLRREVQSLLDQDAATGPFLGAPPRPPFFTAERHADLTGRRVGVYEVISAIGAGGMGEVYRAHDTVLGREVALKVLPSAFTSDPGRLARFEREARLLAALNHPNVATIHGVVDGGGARAIVLELVSGETLGERLRRAGGGLPLSDVASIAIQMIDALDAAHEKGIVHRDLKPANIKITSEGVVKILDFGLAKLDPRAEGASPHAPTMTTGLTLEGVVVGTVAYMSPEQARGLAVDKRTDIWAFGCVLYELLTGRAAFARATLTETLAAVIDADVDWKDLPASASAGMRRLLARCLEKDPRRRLRDIADARLLLDDDRASDVAAPARPQARSVWRLAIAALCGVVVGVAGLALLGRPSSSGPVSPARFEIVASPGAALTTDTYGSNVAIAPDGSEIVYTTMSGSTPVLALRRIDRLDLDTITGTLGGFDPFFSPDGRQVGYATFTELRRIAVRGGPSTTICPVDAAFNGASWGPDDTIVFSYIRRGLFRVAASGGTPEQFAAPDSSKGEQSYARPVVLPGGGAVAYTVIMNDGSMRIDARPVGSGAPTTIVARGFGPQMLGATHLLYGEGDRLMVIAFDPSSLRVSGSPAVVQEGVFTKPEDGTANAGTSPDGTLVFVSGQNAAGLSRIIRRDRRGQIVGAALTPPLESPRFPRISPDGRRLLMTSGPPFRGQVWVYDLAGVTQPIRLTFEDHNIFPIWTPDGRRVTFLRRSGTKDELLSIAADGSTAQPEHLQPGPFYGVPLVYSSDGSLLIFERPDRQQIWVMQSSDRSIHRWTDEPFNEFAGRLSPDGRWMAYASNATGSNEIWVRPFPGPGAPVRISADGGQKPLWSWDGKDIFYENGSRFMAARVAGTAPVFRAEAPEKLFDGGFARDDTDPHIRFVDAAPDGGFVMTEPPKPRGPASIVVAQHAADVSRR